MFRCRYVSWRSFAECWKKDIPEFLSQRQQEIGICHLMKLRHPLARGKKQSCLTARSAHSILKHNFIVTKKIVDLVLTKK